jgi:hypothetical protein
MVYFVSWVDLSLSANLQCTTIEAEAISYMAYEPLRICYYVRVTKLQLTPGEVYVRCIA